MRLSLILNVILLLSFTEAESQSIFNVSSQHAQAEASSKSVIVQMFEWTWDSISAECAAFLGPAGYGYVQTSPPQEHIQGPQWWTDYQLVSYQLTSKRGNRAQFANMISTCHAAGVKVIADTLFNHMSGQSSGTGVGGSSFKKYHYPGVYEPKDFHYCGLEPNNVIVDYTNRLEVQTCELVGLADLYTESEYVRSRLAQYANDLLSLGVDGFRLDASKHIAATDIANITSRFHSKPYITQEVIWGWGEPIQPSEYVGIGNVQEFRYTRALKEAFLGQGISSLRDLDKRGWISGRDANVFVVNHDTERGSDSLNINSPSNTYVTATIFSLAHPYGTPTILSSYDYGATEDGAPNGGAGTCSKTGGANGFRCQHRWIAISGMVGFRNTVGSARMTSWVSPHPHRIAFGRGSAGFVAINNLDSAWTASFATQLVNGSYCDVVSGRSVSGVCKGSSFNVSWGTFNATVPPRSAIAIHKSAKGTVNKVIPVSFAVKATTKWGENVYLVGSIPQLGWWAPTSGVALSSKSYPIWTATIKIPANTEFEYKFVKRKSDGSFIWESDPNRLIRTLSSGTQHVDAEWR